MIDARFLSSIIDGIRDILLRGMQTKSCDDKYAAESSGTARAVVTKQQQEVNEYFDMKAEEIDPEQGAQHQASRGLSRVIDPFAGAAFAEMPPEAYAIVNLIASILAAEHCSFSTHQPSETPREPFVQRLYRSLGLAAHLGWAVVHIGLNINNSTALVHGLVVACGHTLLLLGHFRARQVSVGTEKTGKPRLAGDAASQHDARGLL